MSIWFYLPKNIKRGKYTLLANRDSKCGGITYGESNTNGYGIYIETITPSESYIVIVYSNGEDVCREFSVRVESKFASPFLFDLCSIYDWSHLAVVFKRIDKKSRGLRCLTKLSVFLNGEFVQSKQDVRYLQGSVPFHVGAFYNAQHAFVGTIASVLIFDEALSGTQIADLARYRQIEAESNEKLFIKLRPESLSERIGGSVHLLGVTTVETEKHCEIDNAAGLGGAGERRGGRNEWRGGCQTLRFAGRRRRRRGRRPKEINGLAARLREGDCGQ